MGCSIEWIILGRTKTIQSTQVTASSIFGNCDNVSLRLILPWGQGGDDMFPKGGAPVKIANPSNPTEFVTVRCVDTWCTSSGNSARIEICHTKQAETGKIECSTTPPGASVYYDGKLQNQKTPITFSPVPAGAHSIKYTLPGYDDFESSYMVQPNQTVIAQRDLQPSSGSIHATSTKSGVWASFNANGVSGNRETPATWDNVPVGEYEVTFRYTNPDKTFVECKETASVSKGTTAEVSCTPKSTIKSTVLVLNPIPLNVSEGDQVNLWGTLKTINNESVGAGKTIHFRDVYGANEVLTGSSGNLTATTQENGAFVVKWIAKKMNTLSDKVQIRANFNGIQGLYVASESETRETSVATVEKLDTTLTLNPFSDPLVAGMVSTLTGRLVDSNNTPVPDAEITFKDKDLLFDTNVGIATTTDVDGNYSIDWTVKDLDWITTDNEIYAVYKGGTKYNSSKSAPTPMETAGVKTTLTLETASSGVVVGDKITITGKLTAENGIAMVGKTIKFVDYDAILKDKPLTENGTALTATTTADGNYSIEWTVKKIDLWNWVEGIGAITTGTITFRADFAETEISGIGYSSAVSQLKKVDVSSPKVITKITLNTLPSNIESGSTIKLEGKLTTDDGTALPGQLVEFIEGDTNLKTLPATTPAKTDANGIYSVDWIVDGMLGLNQIRAKYTETEQYRESWSEFSKPHIVETLPEAKNSITIDLTDKQLGKDYLVSVWELVKYPLIDKYSRGSLVDSIWCRTENCQIVFTEANGLVEGTKYTIDPMIGSPWDIKGDDIITFMSDQTITRSVMPYSQLIKKACEMMGVVNCDAFAEMITLDILTPLMDFSAIIEGKDPYTGAPIENVSWYYLFALLGSIPLIGWAPKAVSNAKLSKVGAELADIARKTPEIATALLKEGVLGKIFNFTGTQVGELMTLARNGPAAIADFIKYIDEATIEIPANFESVISGNLAQFGVTGTKLDEMLIVAKVNDDMLDFFHKYTDLLKSIENGSTTNVSDEMVNEIFTHAKTNYHDIDKLLKDANVDLNTVGARLSSMGSLNGDALDSFLKIFNKIDTRFSDAQHQKIVTEIEATLNIRRTENPSSLKEIPVGYGNILDLQKRRIPLDNAIAAAKTSGTEVDETYNLIDETLLFFEILKITPKLEVPKAVAKFTKATADGIIEFMRRNPKFTMTTAIGGGIMIAWFAMDNLPFYAYMYAKYNGIAPGDATWIANGFGDTIDKELWNAKNACDANDMDILKSSIDNAEAKIKEYESYIESEKATLTNANQYEIQMGILEACNNTLILVKDCLRPEMEIPSNGILTDVFITDIIDGDTVDCRIGNDEFRIRVAGINTPDKDGTLYSSACSESNGADTKTVWTTKEVYLESIKSMWSLIDDNMVTLHIDPAQQQDTHGRFVALIFKNDIEINLEMIKSGYACYYSRADFNEDLIDHNVYIAARDAAKAAGLGMWAEPEIPLEFGEVVFSAKKEGATSNLSGVHIWVDGGDYYKPSTTPIKFSPGEHTASFEITGYITVVKKFTVIASKTVIVEAIMLEGENEEQPVNDIGYAIFSAFRETSTGGASTVKATLWSNGSMLDYESDEAVKRKWVPGDHTVTFKKTGYKDIEKAFTIEKEKDTEVKVKMVAGTSDPSNPDTPTAKIDFITSPSAAEIYLDGAYVGLTKRSIDLPEGKHIVSFKKMNYLSCDRTITVVANTPQPVACTLEKFEGGEGSGPDGWETYKPPVSGRRSSQIGSYSPSMGSYGRQPTQQNPQDPQQPEKPPWDLLRGEINVAIVSIGDKVSKQDAIVKEVTKYLSKHCDLDLKFTEIEHDEIEPDEEDGCAVLDDPKYIEEILDPDKFEDAFKIIYLLWPANDVECTAEPGFTGSIEETIFDAMLCSSPTSKTNPEFNKTTGKNADITLRIKHNGSITMLIQIVEALHELYQATKGPDSPELPEFDKEFCKKNFVNERPNAKCIVNWLEEFNNALPEDIKDGETTNLERSAT